MSRGLQAIPLDKLVSAKWNYKGDSEFTMKALIDNLGRNGQIINLIVREFGNKGLYEVTNGNHRLEALRKIGAEEAVCFNLGRVTKDEAVKVAIETNETNFAPDVGKLSRTVTEAVEGTKFNLERHTLPFEKEEVHRFKEMSAIDWKQRPKPPRKGSAADTKAAETPEQAKAKAKKAADEKSKQGPLYDCPNCGHQFDEE